MHLHKTLLSGASWFTVAGSGRQLDRLGLLSCICVVAGVETKVHSDTLGLEASIELLSEINYTKVNMNLNVMF